MTLGRTTPKKVRDAQRAAEMSRRARLGEMVEKALERLSDSPGRTRVRVDVPELDLQPHVDRVARHYASLGWVVTTTTDSIVLEIPEEDS